MSATSTCVWGIAAAVPCRTLDEKSEVGGSFLSTAQGLMRNGPVNRTLDLKMRKLRWEHSQNPTKVEDRRQKWRAQSSANKETQTKAKAVSVSESQFEAEVIKSSIPVLVDFWATWCGPCRLMGIALDWAAQEYDGKLKCVKIETDNNQGLVDKYKVYGLPTLILFSNGVPVPNTHREGALNKDKLQKYIEDNIPAVSSST